MRMKVTPPEYISALQIGIIYFTRKILYTYPDNIQTRMSPRLQFIQPSLTI